MYRLDVLYQTSRQQQPTSQDHLAEALDPRITTQRFHLLEDRGLQMIPLRQVHLQPTRQLEGPDTHLQVMRHLSTSHPSFKLRPGRSGPTKHYQLVLDQKWDEGLPERKYVTVHSRGCKEQIPALMSVHPVIIQTPTQFSYIILHSITAQKRLCLD